MARVKNPLLAKQAKKVADDLLNAIKRPISIDNPMFHLTGLDRGELTSTERFLRRNWSSAMATAVLAELRRRFAKKQPPAGAGREQG